MGCSGIADFDDVVVVIMPHCVHVICDRQGCPAAFAQLSRCPNVHMHAAAADNRQQDFKVRAFVEILNQSHRVGIPLAGEKAFNVVEKWPLVQAFAHEDSGGGGFFTMVHDAIDISPLLEHEYKEVDPLMIYHAVTSHLPRSARQWNGIEALLEQLTPTTSPSTVAEQLTEFWSYSTNQVEEEGKASTTVSKPACETFGHPPMAITMGLSEPRGIVPCARTVLLFAPDFDEVGALLRSCYLDVAVLARDAAHRLRNASESSTLSPIVQQIKDDLDKLVRDNLENVVSKYGWDCAGVSSQCTVSTARTAGAFEVVTDGSTLGRVNKIELVVDGIPQYTLREGSWVLSPKPSLRLLHEDTFLLRTGSLDVFPPSLALPTCIVSSVLAWSHLAPAINLKSIKCLGSRLVSDSVGAELLYRGDIMSVKLLMWEHGAAVVSSTHGTQVFAFDLERVRDSVPNTVQLESGSFGRRDEEEEDCGYIVLRSFPGTPAHVGLVPCTELVFRISTAAYRKLSKALLSSWGEKCHRAKKDTLDVHCLGVLSDEGIANALAVQTVDEIASAFSPETELLPLQSVDPEGRISWMESGKPAIPITIVTGIPGSGKARVCASIMALATDGVKWIMLRQDFTENKGTFSMPLMQQQLAAAISDSAIRLDPTTRILIVTSGFVDVVAVVRGIFLHPDEAVRSVVYIASISCCVDPDNCYHDELQPFPKLLEQAAEGWCNCIILTGVRSRGRSKNATSIETLLRQANSSAAFVRTEDGRVVGSAELEAILALDSFGDPSLALCRAARWPGWTDKQRDFSVALNGGSAWSPPQATVLSFAGHVALDPALLQKELSSLRGLEPATRVFRVKGRVTIVGSTDKHQVQYVRNSRHFSLVAMGNRNAAAAVSALVFVGQGMIDEQLKDAIRRSRPKRPVPKDIRTRDSLTQSELQAIYEANKADPLPEGYYHTGRQYVCMDGTRSIHHPNSEAHVLSWLEKENAAILDFNEQLAQLPSGEDIFALPAISPVRPCAPPPSAGRRRRPHGRSGPAPPAPPD